MTDLYILVLALCGGFIIGTIFFGGLWWTIKKGLDSKKPALWFVCSLLIRFGTTLLGFYLVANNQWDRMLMCLGGFIIARVVTTRFSRALEIKKSIIEKP